MRKLNKRVVAGCICGLFLVAGCRKSEVTFVDANGTETQVMEDRTQPEEIIPETTITEGVQEGTDNSEQKQSADTEPNKVYSLVVHVCGAVQLPGVYELMAGSRVVDAVEAAGGFTADAASSYVNLASEIADGVKIWIPTVEEAQMLGNELGTSLDGISDSGLYTDTQSDKININTADKELLCTLPGIGQTRADSIISYRESHGGFSAIEDIMNVSGIKESSFQKIKEYITVK